MCDACVFAFPVCDVVLDSLPPFHALLSCRARFFHVKMHAIPSWHKALSVSSLYSVAPRHSLLEPFAAPKGLLQFSSFCRDAFEHVYSTDWTRKDDGKIWQK